jgi:hypothetical protein
VDPVPDPLLFRKSGIAGNRTQGLNYFLALDYFETLSVKEKR